MESVPAIWNQLPAEERGGGLGLTGESWFKVNRNGWEGLEGRKDEGSHIMPH